MGRSIEIVALIAFGFGSGAATKLRRAAWFLGGASLSLMLLLTGSAHGNVCLILGCLAYCLSEPANWRWRGRLLLVSAPICSSLCWQRRQP